MPPSRVPSSSSSTSPASPFVVEPAGATREPLYLKENEPGPVLKCGLAPAFRNRSRYELEWLQVAEHTPMFVAFHEKYRNINWIRKLSQKSIETLFLESRSRPMWVKVACQCQWISTSDLIKIPNRNFKMERKFPYWWGGGIAQKFPLPKNFA